jgi:hypothetical protein
MLDRENSTTSRSRSFRILRHGPVLVLFALLTVACGTSGNPGDKSGGSSAAPEAPATVTATPAVEGSGPEQPAPGGNGGPAVKTASLPVGSAGADDPSVRQQCIGVSWLGGEKTHLGEEASVKVTKVRTDRPDLFKPASFNCPNEPCGSFTFDSDTDVCYAAIAIAEKASGSARLFLDGRVVCRSGQQKLCESFASRLEEKAIKISAPGGSPTDSQPGDQTSPESPSPAGEMPSPTPS